MSDEQPAAPTIVVFDIGEIVIDETRVWSIWAELLGVSPLTFGAVLGAAVVQDEPVAAVFAHLAPNVDWRSLEEEHEHRYGGFTPADLYDDVVPCLQALKQAGFVVALAGNQPSRRTAQLAALHLTVDDIVTSEELGADKPDEAFFTALLARLDIVDPSQVLYVGDRVDNDVAAATLSGLRTCWIRRGPWGQLQDLPDGLLPDLSLEGLGELPTLLEDWRDGDDDG